MSETNPCMSCGACCAHFRIMVYPDEGVPATLLEKVGGVLCMQGTNQYPPRCAALVGEVGQAVSCSIYAQRPGVCREFNPFEADGTPNPGCFKLRGLVPPATMQP